MVVSIVCFKFAVRKMDLDQLERELLSIHTERGVYPAEVVAPLRGGNYTLRTLLRSVLLMNLRLAINGQVVWTEGDVGLRLKQLRHGRGLSLRQVSAEAGITSSQVARIERGAGCRKRTLSAYLQAVGADFRLDR